MELKMTKEKPTFEELMKVYEELLSRYPRQHGRKAATFDNTPEGYRRLYNNVKSIQSTQPKSNEERKNDLSDMAVEDDDGTPMVDEEV